MYIYTAHFLRIVTSGLTISGHLPFKLGLAILLVSLSMHRSDGKRSTRNTVKDFALERLRMQSKLCP